MGTTVCTRRNTPYVHLKWIFILCKLYFNKLIEETVTSKLWASSPHFPGTGGTSHTHSFPNLERKQQGFPRSGRATGKVGLGRWVRTGNGTSQGLPGPGSAAALLPPHPRPTGEVQAVGASLWEAVGSPRGPYSVLSPVAHCLYLRAPWAGCLKHRPSHSALCCWRVWKSNAGSSEHFISLRSTSLLFSQLRPLSWVTCSSAIPIRRRLWGWEAEHQRAVKGSALGWAPCSPAPPSRSQPPGPAHCLRTLLFSAAP